MRVTFSGNARDGAIHIDEHLPDYEDVRAFTSALRIFLQADDQISFPWLAKKVYIDPEISENWKQNFVAARTALNTYLDETLRHLIVVNGEAKKTPREIKDVFILGDLAHLDKRFRPTFEEWRNDPFAFPLYQKDFYETLGYIYNCINHLLYWTEQELNL